MNCTATSELRLPASLSYATLKAMCYHLTTKMVMYLLAYKQVADVGVIGSMFVSKSSIPYT